MSQVFLDANSHPYGTPEEQTWAQAQGWTFRDASPVTGTARWTDNTGLRHVFAGWGDATHCFFAAKGKADTNQEWRRVLDSQGLPPMYDTLREAMESFSV